MFGVVHTDTQCVGTRVQCGCVRGVQADYDGPLGRDDELKKGEREREREREREGEREGIKSCITEMSME